jgi:8-oxo-dGTP diphosphatase
MPELRIRKAARAIVINDFNEIIMIKHHDKTAANPLHPGILEFWIPPGGGVEEYESFEAAAIRELKEETGLIIESISDCIFKQSLELNFGPELIKSDERFFFARIPGRPSPTFANAYTTENIVNVRWWSLPEIEASSETFFPIGLAKLMREILDNPN